MTFSDHTFTSRLMPVPVSRWAQVLLGIVFLFAALAKGIDLTRFGRQVEEILTALGAIQSPMLAAVAIALAAGLIMAESVVGAFLLSGNQSRKASIVAIAMLAGFSGLALWALMNGDRLDCGCFGTIITRSAREALTDDLLLLVLAIIGLNSKYPETQNRRIFSLALLASFCFCIYFYIFPSSGAALRRGIDIPENVRSTIFRDFEPRYIWFFNPNCLICQKLIPVIDAVASSAQGSLVGVAPASAGSLEEFKIDFAPRFPIRAIGSKTYGESGIQDGTLIEQKNHKVIKIWPAYLLEPAASLRVVQ